uniref:Membrane protein n=1 Tax=Virgibacillus oceani TaxID=1479511 RepID=A0A917M3P4_9BACI|nr:membrane protein [Virgibacillus oceani]
MFPEINFALKTSYYLVIVYLSIILFKKYVLDRESFSKATTIVSLIVGGSYWLAIVTNTSINSYQYESVGYSGWFFSANELSVIVIVLLALTLLNLRYNKSILSWLAFVFIFSMVPMIGTKTALAGGIVIVFIYAIYLLFTYKLQVVENKQTLLFFGTVILFVCLSPFSPIASNTQNLNYEHSKEIERVQVSDSKNEQSSSLMVRILSSRHLYLQTINEDYSEANGIRKAFGLGYAGDYNEDPKLIEMDFFDLFFSYGLIGSILLLIPLFYLFLLVIKNLLPLSIEKVLLFTALGLCLGIALVAGHVLFAPSVMSYAAILFLAIGMELMQRNDGVKNEDS